MDAFADWSNWAGSFIDTSYDQPVYADTQISTVAQQGQNIATTPVNDGWGDWFKTVSSGLISYAVQKDAQQNQVRYPVQTYGVGNIQQTPQSMGLTLSNPLVLIAGAVVAVLMMKG